MRRTAVCTIISPNYRHLARVLMASLQLHHPQWDRYALVAGGDAQTGEGEPFQGVTVDDLALPHLAELAFRYTLVELDTALKPWLIEHLFGRSYDRVIYFDPDIVVYSELAELEDAPFLVLTPHLTTPVDDEGHARERAVLLAGSWNLGFIAVTRGPQLDPFLDWWTRRLERECVVEPERGLFVDQKWIDLVPGLFDGVVPLRHDGYNVAYWNLRQRAVTRDASGAFQVNGKPLRFFHFSGFDLAFPNFVSRHDPSQRVATSGGAAPLFDAYAMALRNAGFDSFKHAPYAFAHFRDGSRISDAARIAYRNSPQLQEAAGADPFAHPELFRGVTDRKPRLSARVAHRAYEVLSSARPLVRLLPRSLRTTMREGLLGPRATVPARQTTATADLEPGIAIAGYFSRDTGVAESARLCAASFAAAGIPTQLIDVDGPASLRPRASHAVTILHVNADRTPSVAAELHDVLHADSFRIGVWHWELPDFPAAWISSADHLQEIWAPSTFIAAAIARSVRIPVVHMPHGVAIGELAPFPPSALGVPERRFVFLVMFDFDSIMERKNPAAAIEAFGRAFPRDEGVTLLIKTTSASRHPAAFARLQALASRVPHVLLVDQTLTRAQVNGLIASCDAMVSLHRAEGFGLILAEAMALGKPVVATGWSGNAGFMTSGNSCPVAYELVPLKQDYGPYAAGSRWAEPDLDDAARLMSRLVGDAQFRTEVGRRASETIRTELSPAAAGRRYLQRLERLGLHQDEA